MQWLNGRVLDSKSKGCRFDSCLCHLIFCFLFSSFVQCSLTTNSNANRYVTCSTCECTNALKLLTPRLQYIEIESFGHLEKKKKTKESFKGMK